MSITGYIIAGLAAALCAAIAISRAAFSAEKKRHEKEESRIRKEGAENAQRTADIITEASKAKSGARTGNPSHDVNTMAVRLHEYANNQ